MKPQTTRQEILLVINSSLSKMQFCETNSETASHSTLSAAEKLEKACWDGLLAEMLPQQILYPCNNDKKFVWEVAVTEYFIRVSLGPYPVCLAKETSLDPYYYCFNHPQN